MLVPSLGVIRAQFSRSFSLVMVFDRINGEGFDFRGTTAIIPYGYDKFYYHKLL